MTKTQFINLFSGEPKLKTEAEKWWNEVENDRKPCAQLWLKHFQLETRALPQIAHAFKEAITSPDVQDYLMNKGSGAYQLFYALCECVYKDKKNPYTFSGDRIDAYEKDHNGITFLMFYDRVPRPGSVNKNLNREIEDFVERRKKPDQCIWLCPIVDLDDDPEKTDININTVQKRLGLAHFDKNCFVIAMKWDNKTLRNGIVPTILEGTNEFFRPSSSGSLWGWTLNLDTGNKGVREAVLKEDFANAGIVQRNRKSLYWSLDQDYREERKKELCEKLLDFSEQD